MLSDDMEVSFWAGQDLAVEEEAKLFWTKIVGLFPVIVVKDAFAVPPTN